MDSATVAVLTGAGQLRPYVRCRLGSDGDRATRAGRSQSRRYSPHLGRPGTEVQAQHCVRGARGTYRSRDDARCSRGGHAIHVRTEGAFRMTPAGFSVPTVTESISRRVLGGFVFMDEITGNSIPNPLPTTIPQFQLKVNRSGIYAILDGPGLDAFTTEFIPNTATWPAAQTVEVTVGDPSLRYLPR